ncbi:radical SAM/CxCxxxxC motif protein YfkAB, partial [Staphylococcus aureus]
KWLSSDLTKSLNGHCSEFSCVGPNVLVKKMYHQNMDFKDNERHMHKQPQIIQF